LSDGGETIPGDGTLRSLARALVTLAELGDRAAALVVLEQLRKVLLASSGEGE
jgi:hypothetical protein